MRVRVRVRVGVNTVTIFQHPSKTVKDRQRLR